MSDNETNPERPALEGIKVQVLEALNQVPLRYRLEVISDVLKEIRDDIKSQKDNAQTALESASEQEEAFNFLIEQLHLKTG